MLNLDILGISVRWDDDNDLMSGNYMAINSGVNKGQAGVVFVMDKHWVIEESIRSSIILIAMMQNICPNVNTLMIKYRVFMKKSKN